MIENPIVEEIHRICEQMLAEYGGDLHAMIRADRQKTEESAKAGRAVVTRSPRPVHTERNTAIGAIKVDKPEPAGAPGGGMGGGM